MSHLPVLPIMIAAFGGFILTVMSQAPLAWQRAVSVAFVLLAGVVALMSLGAVADGTPIVYALGDWPAPFGIVMVLDRLSALMVALTALVAVFALIAAIGQWDRRGRMFHALFQFQLMGLFGAFLTGDIFNLFVFFEVLLLASYGLILHGHGRERLRAGVRYVVINLTGSALFLLAVGTLYSVTGTLNMADLAVRIPEVAAADEPLLRTSAFLFMVVFGTKAALVPLFLWLPGAYSSTSPPVAALFAIMTKVGVYAILRFYTLAFDAPDGGIGGEVTTWLFWASFATLALGMIGALQARELGRLIAYLTIASVGTMMIAFTQFTEEPIRAGLYYMVHSTLAVAALFLIVEPIARSRAEAGSRLVVGDGPAPWATLGLVFLGLAMAIAGIPPLAGFLGKVMILKALVDSDHAVAAYGVVLVTSLIAIVALSRAASIMFWKSEPPADTVPWRLPEHSVPVGGLFAMMVALTLLAEPFDVYAAGIASDLVNPAGYIDAVLSNRTIVTAEG